MQISGVIDRMDRIPGGGYEIIDYKTSRRLPPKDRVDRDLQLSVYHLAAREIWGIEPERLTLYFLLPGERMTTTRTTADVDELRRRIATVAERIAAGKFEPQQNPLCDWCDFQDRCPLFRHRYEKERGDPAPNMTAMVDEWIALKREDWARYRRLEDLRALINAFCEEHDYRRLYGSDGSALDRRPQHVTAPDPERVHRILEPLGAGPVGGPEEARRAHREPPSPARRRGRPPGQPGGGSNPVRPVPEGRGQDAPVGVTGPSGEAATRAPSPAHRRARMSGRASSARTASASAPMRAPK